LNPNLGTVPYMIDTGRLDVCPETFSFPEAIRRYGGSYKDLGLIRMVKAETIATMLDVPGSDPTAFIELCQAFLDDRSNASLRSELDDSLAVVSDKLDLRPVFAAFFEDVKDDLASSDWADRLRDRMGLTHFNPMPAAPVPVVLLSYKVKDVPPFSDGRDERPLAVPSVLDSRFFPAFCPAPGAEEQGQLVDLAASFDEPVHEVLHGWIRLRAEHVHRVGQVESAVPDDLAKARGTHFHYLQQSCGPADYGRETDQDIIDAV
jgi:hypothetical protein